MAYFPNGMSFAVWQDEHCSDCLNYRDNGTGSFGCAITDAHFILDYHEGTNATVLDSLIPEEGSEQHRCRMRLTREDIEREATVAEQHALRMKYDAAIAEMRSSTTPAAVG